MFLKRFLTLDADGIPQFDKIKGTHSNTIILFGLFSMIRGPRKKNSDLQHQNIISLNFISGIYICIHSPRLTSNVFKTTYFHAPNDSDIFGSVFQQIWIRLGSRWIEKTQDRAIVGK